MKFLVSFNWIKICLVNFALVAVIGVLMRYKIGFEFPYLEQKNLQNAHSHFAFAGWISQILMFLMIHSLKNKVEKFNDLRYNIILAANVVNAYCLLVSFIVSGYGITSIVFSTISILISFIFCFSFYADIKNIRNFESVNWFKAALLFNVLSSAGTFFLIYMVSTKHLLQEPYLASVYWYLHFQYNGWFFFACSGLFIDFLQRQNISTSALKNVFYLFFISCIPAYGLSVLWLKLPIWIYTIVAFSAICQVYAWIKSLIYFRKVRINSISTMNKLGRLLLLSIAFALSIKLLLQLGSTLPALSKLAFGFRPIVIAYLHLVLLAFTSLFLLTYLYINKLIIVGKVGRFGLIIFVIGVYMNEALLTSQGIASLSYKIVPFANEALFVISLLLISGLLFINTVTTKTDV